MSEQYRLYIRTSKAFKRNTRQIVDELHRLELRPNQSLSAYVIEAVREKRERDAALLAELQGESQSVR